MSNRTWTKTSLLILTLTAAAERAPAATICVQPMGMGGCAPTIQAGVDRAAAGDEVRILPGVYFENVVVPASKTGLQIVGVDRPNTILDPSPYGDRLIIHDGPGLLLNATDVRAPLRLRS